MALLLLISLLVLIFLQNTDMGVGDVILLLDRMYDVVGNASSRTESLDSYLSLRLRMCYWSITSLFL